MENELQYTSVADNSLLEFGESKLSIGQYGYGQQLFDITGIFEDGLSFGGGTVTQLRVNTYGGMELVGAAGHAQGELYVLSSDFDARTSEETQDNVGIFFDTNEERDSVVITWSNVGLLYTANEEAPRQTFQAEIIDRGEGDSEIILRYFDIDAGVGTNSYFGVDIYSYYGSSAFRQLLNLDRSNIQFNDLDTRIGNTGVAGVEQILLKDGEPFGFTLTGTDEAELLAGGPLGDVIDGLGGDDTIEGQGGADIITGGEGDDLITSSGSGQNYYGNERIGASIDGGAGNDTLRTGIDDDTIIGGEGDDLINGGHGSNDLSGGEGDDVIRFGGSGQSTVSGGNGDDMIDGSFLNGENSGYYYYGRNGADIDAGIGNDTVLGTNGRDVIAMQDGNDSVLAGGGDDMIFGGEGDDILTGGQGRDTIEGGAGDDFIFGALGADVATGGEGADRFYASSQRGDQMRILDYNYDEGDFLVLDGDLVDRDSIELLYTTALTANGLESRDYNLGIRSENGFQSIFTFGNESEIDQILLRLPATEGGSVAPILFDLSDLV